MKHPKSNVKKKPTYFDLLQICRWLKTSENCNYIKRQPVALKRMWALKSGEIRFSGPSDFHM